MMQRLARPNADRSASRTMLRRAAAALCATVVLAMPALAQPSSESLLQDLSAIQQNNFDIQSEIGRLNREALPHLEKGLTEWQRRDVHLGEVAETMIDTSRVYALAAINPRAAGGYSTELLKNILVLGTQLNFANGASEAMKADLRRFIALHEQMLVLQEGLDASWTRYDAIVADAKALGILGGTDFDPSTGTWTISSPDRPQKAEPAAPELAVGSKVGAWTVGRTEDGRFFATTPAVLEADAMETGEFEKLGIYCARDGGIKFSLETYDWGGAYPRLTFQPYFDNAVYPMIRNEVVGKDAEELLMRMVAHAGAGADAGNDRVFFTVYADEDVGYESLFENTGIEQIGQHALNICATT